MFQQIAYEQIQKFVESGRARSIAQRLCTSTPNRRRRRRRHRQRDTKPAVRRQRTTVRLHQCNLLRCAGRRAPTARRSCSPTSTHTSPSRRREAKQTFETCFTFILSVASNEHNSTANLGSLCLRKSRHKQDQHSEQHRKHQTLFFPLTCKASIALLCFW